MIQRARQSLGILSAKEANTIAPAATGFDEFVRALEEKNNHRFLDVKAALSKWGGHVDLVDVAFKGTILLINQSDARRRKGGARLRARAGARLERDMHSSESGREPVACKSNVEQNIQQRWGIWVCSVTESWKGAK